MMQVFLFATPTVLSILKYLEFSRIAELRWSALAILSFILNFLIFTFYYIVYYPFLADPLRHLPGPKGGLPLVGYAFEINYRPPSTRFEEWMNTIANDGILRVPHIFGSSSLLPTSARAFSQVLVTRAYDFTKDPSVRRILSYVLGDGLVTSEFDVHRIHRKHMSPIFGHRSIKNLHPLIWSKVALMTSLISAEVAPDVDESHHRTIEVEVYSWASRAALDIIGVVALGYDFNSLKHSDDKLAQLYEWFFTPDRGRSIWFAMSTFLPNLVMKYLPWRIEDRIISKSRELRWRCEELVKQKRSDSGSSTTDRVDVLANMIKADCFNNKELVDEALAMLAAGHETTSSTLTWTLYALAKDPELQDRLQKEVSTAIEIFAASSSLTSIEFSDVLDSLPLLHGVCNESQRLWPAVPVTARVANQDTEIDGQRVPRGTRIIIPMWSINKLPAFWGNDAKKFQPERWINADNGKPNNHGGCQANFGFMTYLHGPRSCIGQGLARAELKALVAAWLYCFDFELMDPSFEAVAVGIVTVKPEGGLKLKMKVRASL